MAIRLCREATNQVAERAEWPVGVDLFVPTDAGPDLGDGTVPLFSATGGALLRVDQRPDLAKAIDLLGPRVKVVVDTLSPGKSHRTALDDAGVRASIVATYHAARHRSGSARQ
jgi:hypothetical protein